MNYDIIGDIHGHADKLKILLEKLGYVRSSGVFHHPKKRQVVFLGDYIDRGPKIPEVLEIVRSMCEAESAYAIMGNHEFNAVCFATPKESNGGFYRKHGFKEIKQHFETLKQFKDNIPLWETYLDWFKTLPMFLEFEQFRVVHACWDDQNIDWIREARKNPKYDSLTPEFLSLVSKKDQKNERNKEYFIIEETLKGKEKSLPKGEYFYDKYGTKRFECRVRWWQPMNQRILNRDMMIGCSSEYGSQTLEANGWYSYLGDPTVFFGHYWLEGSPQIINSKAICLDYSVARGGNLVAFRSEGLENIQNIDQYLVVV